MTVFIAEKLGYFLENELICSLKFVSYQELNFFLFQDCHQEFSAHFPAKHLLSGGPNRPDKFV